MFASDLVDGYNVCVYFCAYQLYAVIKRTLSHLATQGQSTVLCTLGKYILGALNPLTSASVILVVQWLLYKDA